MTAELPDQIRAFQAVNDGDEPHRGVVSLTPAEVGSDGVWVEVHYSSVNYKDGLAATPKGRVARISPIIPGVDLAGVLLEDAGDIAAGTEVIVHGLGLGEIRNGGFAEYAQVPPEWVVALPAGLSMHDSMTLGTAGFTAALSVIALQDHGVGPDSGPVLVTGATGGVGSTAVDMLARNGYHVVASTGKPSEAGFLTGLGAAEVVDRAELSEATARPLETPQFAAAIDCVGGVTLANILKRLEYGGCVAASGLTGGANLETTVMPFILRGVHLVGIDSVQLPMDRRVAAWHRVAADLRPNGLDAIAVDITLDDLDRVLTGILDGRTVGRNVVSLR